MTIAYITWSGTTVMGVGPVKQNMFSDNSTLLLASDSKDNSAKNDGTSKCLSDSTPIHQLLPYPTGSLWYHISSIRGISHSD